VNIRHRLALTVSYLTCFPLAKLSPEDKDTDLQGLSKYLPAAGLLIGLLLAVVSWLLHLLNVSGLLQGTLLTLCWLAFTGGLHFDGLMDTADGILSHRDRQRMLEIMSDSRVGNFGALAGISVILLKVACLSTLPYPFLFLSLTLIPCWARFCETLAIGRFPYLRPSGMGKIWHDSTCVPQDFYRAAVIPLISTLLLTQLSWKLSVFTVLAVLLGGLWTAAIINKILGGHTGDTYGATVELAETSGLLLLTFLAQSPLAACLP
jgi:adenosylcobinamide-GDP ribazoletransferase